MSASSGSRSSRSGRTIALRDFGNRSCGCVGLHLGVSQVGLELGTDAGEVLLKLTLMFFKRFKIISDLGSDIRVRIKHENLRNKQAANFENSPFSPFLPPNDRTDLTSEPYLGTLLLSFFFLCKTVRSLRRNLPSL